MKQTETLMIRRRSADRIVAIHKIDGATVGREQVKRHPDDADDFLTGAIYAITKLCANGIIEQIESIKHNHESADKSTLLSKFEKLEAAILENTPDYILYHSDPRNLKAGDRALLQSQYIAEYINPFPNVSTMIGDEKCNLVTIHSIDKWHYCIIEEDGRAYRWACNMFAGKIVPCGKLKAGDEVLVKGVKEGELDSYQAHYANKIIKITRVDYNNGHYFNNVTCFLERRFVGKLIRFKQEVPHA
jgi:hypothetical protein